MSSLMSFVNSFDEGEEAHPRLREWWMMVDHADSCYFIAAYLLFVKLIAPSFMRHRKPYELRLPMVAYNIALVGLNAYVCLEIFLRGWAKNYRWRCQEVDFSDDEDAIEIARACYVYYVSKFIEFADTVFFVLRKKEEQVTKLHVFHHAAVAFSGWYIRFAPGGWNTMTIMLNSFVHVWMYLYYGLAAFGPQLQKYLWWKRHLTKLQLVQFTIIGLYMANLLLFPVKGCYVSKVVLWVTFFNAAIFFLLFADFYLNSYRKKKPHHNGKRR